MSKRSKHDDDETPEIEETEVAEQADLDLSTSAPVGPVECLGRTFPNDEARREYFLKELAKKLKDPAFRKIEGFPIGEDEDILALSDPPYYTACPNPWLADFIKQYGKPYNPKDKYHREPFAADVSEGKTHPMYNAHSYHTKVPHRAIMRYLLHYTLPGDTVFDGFCGSGMTGVAAQLCGDHAEIQSLGYRVQKDGAILDGEGKTFSRIGSRLALLNDLAPAATFIAYDYNTPLDPDIFGREARRILAEVQDEIGWMYQTTHTDGKTKGIISFTVWSQVYACPECAEELEFLEEALNHETNKVQDSFRCSKCHAALTKRQLQVLLESRFDHLLGTNVRVIKRRPVLIEYRVGRKTYQKQLDRKDHEVLDRIKAMKFPATVPVQEFAFDEMWEAPRLKSKGITHIHHLFTDRALHAIAAAWQKVRSVEDRAIQNNLRALIHHQMVNASIRNTYRPASSFGNRALTSAYYVSAMAAEANVVSLMNGSLKRILRAKQSAPNGIKTRKTIIGTQSTTSMAGLSDSSVDYVFIDPPFGDNFPYAELNLVAEAWHGVRTQPSPEAIVDRSKANASVQRDLDDYRHLITACFAETYRVLRPGRWMTVEFSNTKAAVWNSIQSALQEVGFVVANVSALDKQQGSFKAITTPTAVKQDLVISAYKPNGGLEERFVKKAETEEGVWDFLRTHLNNLPVVKLRGGQLEPIAERDPRILYDRTVAFYVRHGIPVPISSPEFQAGLAEKFSERDGMYFLPDQAAEYDKVRMKIDGVGQLTIFVEDERSAVDWLRNYLKAKPSKYSDVMPEFFKQLDQSWKKWETKPELRALLDQYFLCYSGEGDVPSQIHNYLSTNFKELRNLSADHAVLRNKARDRWYVPDPRKNSDVEQLREKRLLEEFWSYLPAGYEPAAKRKKSEAATLPGMEAPKAKIPKGKRLAIVRTEAVRVGFSFCFGQNDYQTIIAVARHIPEDVIHNDEQLQMIYDSAVTRTGAEPE